MTAARRFATWSLTVVVLALLAALVIVGVRRAKAQPITLRGAVVSADEDVRKQLPIAGVAISSVQGAVTVNSQSDSQGFFRLTLPHGIKRGQEVSLKFTHADYQSLKTAVPAGDDLYVMHMVPISHAVAVPDHPVVSVANVRMRYSVKTTTTVDVGSVVKTFEVANTGNVPCKGQVPCSPDGRWKATIGSTSLDAGGGNQFRNVRLSCIAGPCPFTKVETNRLTQNGRMIDVSVRNWSDTTTFLVEAEVVHPMVADTVRNSYPVIFGPSLSFTLPALAEGPSIEAEINGEPVLFPLGPDLCLTWADCTVHVDQDQAKAYHCELKPGYRFR
jgi:hypothetical protein